MDQSKKGTRIKKEKPEWQLKKPDDITKSVSREGKTYWWCERYNVWAIHNPEDCKPLDAANKQSDTEKKKKSSQLVEAAETLEENNSSTSE